MASLSAQINVSLLTLLLHFPGHFHWLGAVKTPGPPKLLAHLCPCLMKSVVYRLRLVRTADHVILSHVLGHARSRASKDDLAKRPK